MMPDSKEVSVEFSLRPMDIFRLILRIHGVLIILPFVFIAGFSAVLISGRYVGWELYVYFSLFCLSIVLIGYVYLSQYFIFKKLLFYSDSSVEYYADFSKDGLTVHQGGNKNLTFYLYSDFIKARETKKTLYLFFRYDRALIIKKQFKLGDATRLRDLMGNNIKRFKPSRH